VKSLLVLFSITDFNYFLLNTQVVGNGARNLKNKNKTALWKYENKNQKKSGRAEKSDLT
jgi:hypothetical protein